MGAEFDFGKLGKETAMSWERELAAIARGLRKATPYFKGGWNCNALQAFIRDSGCCAYCGKPLLDSYGVSKEATIDHLLPSCTYHLGWNVDNLVPACATCNRIKLDYDPSEGKGGELVITAEVRLNLIHKVKEEIDRLNKADDYWEKEFQAARPLFQEAVARYLKLKESIAAV
jgi:5-methylcytosine-specific restriction endonuclease McrA